MITAHETEITSYFGACNEVRAALESGDSVLADLALGEIFGLWLHSTNLKLRDRCAETLERHGWGAEMARACAA